MLTQVVHALDLSNFHTDISSPQSAGLTVRAACWHYVLWSCLLTLHGFGLQVVKAPSSPAEDALLVVQKGFMQVSVSMNEIQNRKPK